MIIPEDQKVVWVGPFAEHSGYAYMNREFVRGLHNVGWNMGIEPIPCPNEISFEDTKFFNSLRNFKHNRASIFWEPDVIKIVGWIPLSGVPSFKHNVIYTMMESKNVGENFISHCNSFYNSCWTTTQYYAERMVECGMKIPIKIMPIGVDEIFNRKNIKEKDLDLDYKVFYKRGGAPEKPSGYKFLSLFRWNYKKGYDVLIKSFLKEFTYKDDVSLVIISKHAAMVRAQPFSDAVFNDIAELVEKYATNESPPIYWSENNITQEDMPTVYGKCDCFVLPSRGEGLCMPALEASRMGLPTILPYHTGFTEYVSDETSFKVEVDKWEICSDNPKWGNWVTKIYFGQEFPVFGDSVVEEVSFLMRKVKDNPDLAQKKVEAMNRVIDEKFTWGKCIDRSSKELLEIING